MLLGSFVIFKGILTSIAKKSYFCDFAGWVRTPCPPPPSSSGSKHGEMQAGICLICSQIPKTDRFSCVNALIQYLSYIEMHGTKEIDISPECGDINGDKAIAVCNILSWFSILNTILATN